MKYTHRFVTALACLALLASACSGPAGSTPGPTPTSTTTATTTATNPPPGPGAPSVELSVPSETVTSAAPLNVRINLNNFASLRGLSIEIMEGDKILGRAFDSVVSAGASAYQLYTFADLSSAWNRTHTLTARVTDSEKRVLTSAPVNLNISIPNLNLDAWSAVSGAFEPATCPPNLQPSASSAYTTGYAYEKFFRSLTTINDNSTVIKQRIGLAKGTEGILVRALVGNPAGDEDFVELAVRACNANDECTVFNTRRSSLDFRRPEIDLITTVPPVKADATVLEIELRFKSVDATFNAVAGNIFVGYIPK